MRKWLLAFVGLLAWLTVVPVGQQSLPLLQASDIRYLGSFTVPDTDGLPGDGHRMIYGGEALGVTPDGKALYFGCVPVQTDSDRIAKISIPAIGGRATILTTCQRVPNLAAVDPDTTNGYVLGGTLEYNGRLILSAYSYYDAQGTDPGSRSHFWGTTTLTNIQGPVKVGTGSAAFVAGYMGLIPKEWQALFGGPALTGQCCLNNIARTSYGPAVRVFNPSHIGTLATIPTTTVLEYPQGHYLDNDWNQTSTTFNGTTQIGGVAFPSGTRTVFFFGRQGTGPFCYGICAGDPVFGDISGSHAYPYRNQIWAYDANDLLAVKWGQKMSWQPRPYAIWPIPDINNDGRGAVTSAAYHDGTRRLYVTASFGDSPRVHAFEVGKGSGQPPPPEVCSNKIDDDGDGQIDEGCPVDPPPPGETMSFGPVVKAIGAKQITVPVPVSVGGVTATINLPVTVPADSVSVSGTCTRPVGSTAWTCTAK